jgi:hypothetical protein
MIMHCPHLGPWLGLTKHHLLDDWQESRAGDACWVAPGPWIPAPLYVVVAWEIGSPPARRSAPSGATPTVDGPNDPKSAQDRWTA